VSSSINDLLGPRADEYLFLAFASDLFFGVASIYMQIAMTMAAASSGEPHGADPWIKAALRRRCFWRYLGASLLAVILILVGVLALVVGAVVVGAALVLTQAAVVLEQKGPVDALRRSAELTKPVRRQTATIFLILWLPALVPYVLIQLFEIELNLAAGILFSLAGNVLSVLGTIAFTRTFVKLGGAAAPPLQTLLYKDHASSDRR
jgi:hypothetical protein